MKLRFLQVYNKNGQQTSPELQYWDEEEKIWKDVLFVRVPVYRVEEVMKDKDAV